MAHLLSLAGWRCIPCRNCGLSLGAIMSVKRMPPVHPGEILLEDFLKPLGLSQYRLAHGLSVPPRRIDEMVLGNRSISADTALRPVRYSGTLRRYSLSVQTHYD